MKSKTTLGAKCMAVLKKALGLRDSIKVGGHFMVKCFGSDGQLKWEDSFQNTVVDVGLEHLLDILFVSATTQIDPWYIGLTDGTPTVAAGDTMGSHAGWVEVTDYAGSRKAYVDVRSGQSVTNAASKGSFAIDQDSTTIGGAFLVSDASGAGGILLCAEAFAGGDKSADNGDTLEVTYVFAAADA